MVPQRTFYEFFAGGGMARLGLGDRWRCTFSNDFDPVKAATYRSNFPGDEHFREGDIWNLSADDLPGRADLAWASSPCQDFSLAGGRAGLKGDRSSAFFGFWRLVEELATVGRAPRMIVIENVVGLLSSHGGADFVELCRALARRGYWFGAVEIDAARFVAQSRPRIFLIATHASPSSDLVSVDPIQPFHSKRIFAAVDLLPREVRARWHWWRLSFPPPSNQTLESVLEDPSECTWFSPQRRDHLLALMNNSHSAKLQRAKELGDLRVGTVFRRMRTEDGKKVQRAELRFDGFAGCLRTPGGGSSKQFVVHVKGGDIRVRALTPREGARLMGLDDQYVLPERKQAALKVVGDGVVVPAVRFLSENLLERLAMVADEPRPIDAKARVERQLADARRGRDSADEAHASSGTAARLDNVLLRLARAAD